MAKRHRQRLIAESPMRRPLLAVVLLSVLAGILPSGAASAQAAFPSFVRVNFQPASAPAAPYHAEPQPGVTSTYRVDSGQPFGSRGGGLSHGWVAPGTTSPRDLRVNTRDRNAPSVAQRLDTLIHMQPLPASGGEAGSWELALPDGAYTVVVAAGDPSHLDSTHRLLVEGVVAVDDFSPTAGERHRTATRHVTVGDGRLTVAAAGGANTKLHYVEVYRGHRPYITGIQPLDGQTGVLRDGQVSASIQVVTPPDGNGVEPSSLTAANVRLVRASDGQPVAGARGTTGGNDAVNFDADGALAADTTYRFEVDYEVTDEVGNPFVPLWSTFTTGTQVSSDTASRFTREAQSAVPERFYTSVTMGPDGDLYAGTIDGFVYRFDVAADGTLGGAQEIDALVDHAGGPRMLIGMAFDPASTAAAPTLWVSHSTFGFADMPDWGGAISTLGGPGLATVTDEVTGLPRSAKDHLTNGLAFGPDGALYVSQGANTAGGERDPQWGDRPERLLSAAILRVDTGALAGLDPLHVQTEETADPYDPRPVTAPVRVHASGVRNAYDLVWADNDQLYTAINGTAGNAIAPATPATLPGSCGSRLVDGGPYTGSPSVPGVDRLPLQPDLAARIEAGGYYGNPNPSRCEWVINGGNPTGQQDLLEVVATGDYNGYPQGTGPDPNWRSARIHPLGNNLSPNGMIEYDRDQDAELDGTLMVAAFSNCNCILVLSRDAVGDVSGQTILDVGSYVLENPLDLAQGPGGVVYVTNRTDEAATTGSIELLRPPA